ncbi:uncharacterized protein LOC116981886 isoform X1 [Amblyraja radiata]|uniref:uncharacterized protein LOC116981886 isoform X1 n=1 Tax=Amblyraja radiata TaxID=386614 RepID=UPI001402FB1B|nr:uncharacterized protein LOC116981886 isoform X1 [Amblyraja radiata]
MSLRRRKGHPVRKAQPPSPLSRQVETDESQEEEDEDQEETREVARVPITAPARTGRPANTPGTVTADPDSLSDEDTDASSVSNVSTVQEEVKKRRRPNAAHKFSWEEEGELVEWYQSNPELYDKNHQHFRNKDRKNSLLSTKAKEFPDCTYERLNLFFKSQRTRYSHLTQGQNKSGSGAKYLTHREQWIVDKWSFIKPHIVRVESRQNNKKKKQLPSVSSEEEFDPLEGNSGSTPSASQQHSKRSRTTANSTAGSTLTAIEVEEREASQQLIKSLMQQATEAREARLAMTQPQTPHERAVDTFLGFLKTEVLKIPENIWFDYTMAAMKVAHNFSQPTQQQRGHMGQL